MRANYELIVQMLKDENQLALEKGKLNNLTTIFE
jgi:hypothetical protein